MIDQQVLRPHKGRYHQALEQTFSTSLRSFEELREIRWVEWSEEGDWNLIWEEMERAKIILWSC